jgi:ligand-binding sensor domain-containing protein
MTKYLLSCPWPFLLLPFLFATACNGQEEAQAPRHTQVDPLFYLEGQLCQHLRRIHQDRHGNLWMGTNIYGLMRYDGDTLVYFTEKDGLGRGRITGIVEDAAGNLWIGTASGLSKYDGTSFTNFTKKDGLVDDEIWSLIIDRSGTFWIGTMNGASRLDGKEFTTFPIPKAEVKDADPMLSANRVSAIMEDKKGNIWFGLDGYGISIYNGGSFSHLTKESGLPDNNITHILEDKNGDIWISSMSGGISRYDGKAFTNFTQQGVIEGEEVWSVYEDEKGDIWFPAENAGVYRYDGETFANFNAAQGLQTNAIQCIFEDRQGRFWLGGWGGLFRYDPAAGPSGKTFFSVAKDGPWD